MSIKRIGTLAFVLSAIVPAGAVAQGRDTLTLRALYDQLQSSNPRLKALGSLIDATQAREGATAVPSDPQLQVGAMNLSLPGLSADMPSSMAPAIQLMQMVPFPGKLGLASSVAKQETAMARSDAAEAWWEVRAQAAMAFYELAQAEAQIGVMRETLELLGRMQKIAQAMYASGSGRQADVLRAGVEIARMQADITRMTTMRSVAEARINALLNRAPQTPVIVSTAAPATVALPVTDTLLAWAEATRPMLAKGRVAVEQAQSRAALARREIWPDFTVGLQYGQRPSDMGTERMGSVMLGFSVPVFAKQRQLRMRDEAAAMKQMAEADLAAMRANTGARVLEITAELERARSLMQLYDRDVLPQANAT
ncbi:MAG TPA: TolC family protein, partial [Longimicrobiales bacterium]